MLKLLKVLLLLVHLVKTADVIDEVEDTNPEGSCSKDGASDSCDTPKKDEPEEEGRIDPSDMYKTNSLEVTTLTDDNFEEMVLKSENVWMIKLYSPTCGHCTAMHPEWVKAAKQLRGIVKFGAVNDVAAYNLSKKYNAKSVPKVFFYSKAKKEVEDYRSYNGPRDSASFVKFALDSLYEDFKPMMKASRSQNMEKEAPKKKKKAVDDRVTLTVANFDEKVMKSKEIWMVEFYAPWCGHCKSLEPEYKSAASQLRGQKVNLGLVDATVEEDLARRFDIKGFPTLKIFNYGLQNKKDSKAHDYNGGRTAKDIVDYLSGLADKADIEPDVYEIVKQGVYDDNCQGTVICIINFLPNIYDSNAKERKGYLNAINAVAKKNRKAPFRWFWLQAGDQLDLERQLNLGFGFPAVIAVSPNKKMIATMRGSFSEDNVNSFLTDVQVGKGGLQALRGEMTFKKADKWDGKDSKPVEEMEYDDL